MRRTVSICTFLTLGLMTVGGCGSIKLESHTNNIGMECKLIPAGEFMMGSPASDGYPPKNVLPQHKVRITKPFYLSVTEVTQEQYEKVMGKNPSYFSKTGRFADKVEGIDTSSFPVEPAKAQEASENTRRSLPERLWPPVLMVYFSKYTLILTKPFATAPIR